MLVVNNMSSSKKSAAKASDDFKQEELLQAVVIADSFNVRFVPLTNCRPRALLPLVNVPILDYTLEFLSAAGVQRTIVFCCVHAEQIKLHIQRSKWSKNGVNGMEVTTLVSEGCLSLGDALRDLEAKSILRTDFVLVHGDLVSNIKLSNIVEEHRNRRQSVKGSVMTMVYKTALPGHRTRSAEDELAIAIQSQTKRVVGHQRLGINGKKLVLQREAFDSHRAIEVRHDLLDCHIAICSPLVLQLMADNFDFETVDDLVHGILVNEEVLNMSVFSHVIDGVEYASRVTDVMAYDAVSEDVMSRWAYPRVPDQNISGTTEDIHAYRPHNVYVQQDVVLQRGSSLAGNVAVGHGSVIGENSSLVKCVVGSSCKIGKNVRITDSFIFSDVVIGDDCCLSKVVIDVNAVIGSKCKLSSSIVGAGVVLRSDTTIPQNTRLVVGDTYDVDGFNLVPFDGYPNLFTYADDDDSHKLYYSDLPDNSLNETLDSSSESEDENGDLQAVNEEKLITDEMSITLERAIEENISSENVIVEINSIKHAYGIQIKELNGLLIRSFLTLPLRNVQSSQPVSGTQYIAKFQAIAKRFHLLMKNYFRSPDSQKDLLIGMEDSAQAHQTILAVLPKVIHYLYDAMDVLSETAILEWWQQMEGRSLPVRQSLDKFIQWLKTADEDDDEDDDSDE